MVRERIQAAVERAERDTEKYGDRFITYQEKVRAIIAFHEQGVPACMILDAIREVKA